jgi:rhamnose transport system ATP-binding protein
MSEPGPPPLLALNGVRKSFGAVAALRDGRLDLHSGEAHALVGENGAGKSTLVRILAGVHPPDAGTMTLDGEPLGLRGPADARAAGIAVIYQEPTLFPDLSVAENIFIGRQPQKSWKRIDTAAMRRKATELFDRLGVHLDPDRPARGLSIADQQLVEIAKALSFDARILVMDEPTAALSGVEVERLFAVARSLRDAGAAVLFISHRFDEVFALCQRITVMRDGSWVSTDPTEDLTVDGLVRRMVGRDISALFPHPENGGDKTVGEPVIEVRGLTRTGVFDDVSFSVRAGEIVALAGLVGAGRSEVVRAMFGVDRYDSGEVLVAGRRLPPGRPGAAIAAGLALVPEDRRQQGLVMDLSVERNATLVRRWKLSRLGLLGFGAERRSAQTWTQRLQVKAGSLGADVSTLSGGNQQKVVLAKGLTRTPKVAVLDEPTRGVDVGAIEEIHALVRELADAGVAVVVISSYLPEILALSDRILVARAGRIVAEFETAEANEEKIMFAAVH